MPFERIQLMTSTVVERQFCQMTGCYAYCVLESVWWQLAGERRKKSHCGCCFWWPSAMTSIESLVSWRSSPLIDEKVPSVSTWRGYWVDSLKCQCPCYYHCYQRPWLHELIVLVSHSPRPSLRLEMKESDSKHEERASERESTQTTKFNFNPLKTEWVTGKELASELLMHPTYGWFHRVFLIIVVLIISYFYYYYYCTINFFTINSKLWNQTINRRFLLSPLLCPVVVEEEKRVSKKDTSKPFWKYHMHMNMHGSIVNETIVSSI